MEEQHSLCTTLFETLCTCNYGSVQVSTMYEISGDPFSNKWFPKANSYKFKFKKNWKKIKQFSWTPCIKSLTCDRNIVPLTSVQAQSDHPSPMFLLNWDHAVFQPPSCSKNSEVFLILKFGYILPIWLFKTELTLNYVGDIFRLFLNI